MTYNSQNKLLSKSLDIHLEMHCLIDLFHQRKWSGALSIVSIAMARNTVHIICDGKILMAVKKEYIASLLLLFTHLRVEII